jgi:hypothetical protein
MATNIEKMRIEIEKPVEFKDLQMQFRHYKIIGHIEVSLDGTWFVVDKIEPEVD